MDINTAYASVSGTTKHVGTSWVQPQHVEASLEMFHLIAGGEDKWRARPFVKPVQLLRRAPLKFAYDACLFLETAVRGGMPVLLLSAGQSGRDGRPRRSPPRWCRRCRVPRGAGLRQCHQAGRTGDFRHLVLRVRSAYRRDVGRQSRAGAAVRGERPDVALLLT